MISFSDSRSSLGRSASARVAGWELIVTITIGHSALVAEVIRRCPSGALHYQAPGIPGEQPDVPATIRVVEGGPFLLRGDLLIQAADGWVADTRAALCRCTRSARQPFCDAECDAPEPPGLPGRPEEQAP